MLASTAGAAPTAPAADDVLVALTELEALEEELRVLASPEARASTAWASTVAPTSSGDVTLSPSVGPAEQPINIRAPSVVDAVAIPRIVK